ncbi:MAG: VOC family protein [Anaerolineae bacterium]|nr:VOC family protein [Anaerolineae bacterium]
MLANSPVAAILPAVDLERAKKFYKEKLGLQPVDAPGPGGAMFEGGQGTGLYLYQRDTPTKADHTVAGWQVENIEEVVQALRERGVVFEQYDLPGLKTDEHGIATMGPVKSAWFKDTEGNILAISEFG